MSIIGSICAYIALILLIILCVKPLLRKKENKTDKTKKMIYILTKYHVLISILFLIFLVGHIVLSTDNSFSLYTAKISVVFLFLSLVTILMKKLNAKLFIKLHYIFSILCLIFSIIHIIEVKLF